MSKLNSNVLPIGFISPREASRLLGYKNEKQIHQVRRKPKYKQLKIREVKLNSRRVGINKADLLKCKLLLLRFTRYNS